MGAEFGSHPAVLAKERGPAFRAGLSSTADPGDQAGEEPSAAQVTTIRKMNCLTGREPSLEPEKQYRK